MHKLKRRSSHSSYKSDWLEFLDDCLPTLVIPIGPRFQADVPKWSGPAKEQYVNGEMDTSRWLGTRVWPPENCANDREGTVGYGRPNFCKCSLRGSLQCVEQHVSEARAQLKSSLGSAFEIWKFNEMGDDVGKSWTSKQKIKFDNIVKKNSLSQAKSFLQPAELSFPSKTRKDIVSYYLNVYVPKRIGVLTRLEITVLDSDDEVFEALNAKNLMKRSQVHNDDYTKVAKSHYLSGRR